MADTDYSGEGMPEDVMHAIKRWRKAAEQCNLGHAYDWGEGVPEDPVLAAGCYRKAAEEGYAEGQYLFRQYVLFRSGRAGG